MTDRQKPKRPEVRGHLSPAHYAEVLEQYVEELDAYYADIVYRRERTCVWTQYEDRGWRPGCGLGADPEDGHPEGPPPHVWEVAYCPYCGGRVETIG